jgi:hypothetical protein
MVAIQNVQGLGGVPSDDVQIGLPPVRADEFDERAAFLAEPGKELVASSSEDLSKPFWVGAF